MLQVCFAIVLLLVVVYSVKGLNNSGYALALVWSTYSLEQFLQYSNSFFVTYGSLVNFGVVFVAICSVLNGLRTRKIKRLRLSKAHIWWILLMALATISIFWAVSTEVSLTKYRLAAPYIVGFCVIAPYCAHDRKQIDNAIKGTVLLGGMILFGMLFCNFGARAIVLAFDGQKAIEGNPLAVATYGGYVLICSAFSIYAHKSNALVNLGKIAISFLAVYLIVRSGSRGQLIAAIVACLVWMPFTAKVAMKRSTVVAIIFGCVFAFAANYFLSSQDDLSWRWSSTRLQADQFGRFEMAKTILLENLETGPWAWLMGLGSSSSFPILNTYPHIVPAEILAEEGLFGLVLFVGFILVAASVGYKAMNLKSIDVASRVNVGTMMTLFSFQLLLSFKQGTLLGQTSLFGVGLCIALAAERVLSRQSQIAPQAFVNPNYPPQGFHPNVSGRTNAR